MDGTLCPPTNEGWGDGTYVVVVSTPKPSSDANGSETESGLGYSSVNAPSVGEFLPSLFTKKRYLLMMVLKHVRVTGVLG